MKKKERIVRLPTEKGVIRQGVKVNDTLNPPLILSTQAEKEWGVHGTEQHLYLISDEESKEGDYFIDFEGNLGKEDSFEYPIERRKVIATTDDSLRNMGDEGIIDHVVGKDLPKISEDFIKVYVKAYNEGNPIEEVMVEYCCQRCGVSNNKHKMGCKDSHLWVQVPKLRDDNTVIISMIEESIPNREQVARLVRKAFKLGLELGEEIGDWHAVGCSGPKPKKPYQEEIEEDPDKWIRENL